MLTIDPTLLSVGSVWKYGAPKAHVQDACLIHLVDKKKNTPEKCENIFCLRRTSISIQIVT